MGGNGSQSFDKFKRAFMDLVYDLHARKLAIPAAAMLVAILAAVFMLPKAPTPPPAITTPVSDSAETVDTAEVVSLKLVGISPLDNDDPLTNSSDPFSGTTAPDCKRVGSGSPKRFECRVGDLLVIYTCLPGVVEGICGEGASGATGSSESGGGSSESTGGSSGATGESKPPKSKPKAKSTYYVVTATLDGRTYKNIEAGDGLPNEANALAVFAGASDSGKSAIFISGDGVTATGVKVNDELGTFQLAKGKSATLLDKAGAEHTLTVKSIKKVTK